MTWDRFLFLHKFPQLFKLKHKVIHPGFTLLECFEILKRWLYFLRGSILELNNFPLILFHPFVLLLKDSRNIHHLWLGTFEYHIKIAPFEEVAQHDQIDSSLRSIRTPKTINQLCFFFIHVLVDCFDFIWSKLDGRFKNISNSTWIH